MKKKPNPENIFKTWPLFFCRKCSKCKLEFRREWGWRSLGAPIINGEYTERYYCTECCKTIYDVDAARNKRPPRPPPPPMAPPNRIIIEGRMPKKQR